MYLPNVFNVLSSFDSTSLSGLFAQWATPKLSKLKSVGLSDLKGAKKPAFEGGEPANFAYLNLRTGFAALDNRGIVYATRYGSWPTSHNIFENMGISGNISEQTWEPVFVEYRGKNKFRVVMDDPKVKGPALYAVTQYAFIPLNPTEYIKKLALLDKNNYKKALNNRNTPVHIKSDGFKKDEYIMPSLIDKRDISSQFSPIKAPSLQTKTIEFFSLIPSQAVRSSSNPPSKPVKLAPPPLPLQEETKLAAPFSSYVTELVEENDLQLEDRLRLAPHALGKRKALDPDTGLVDLPGGHPGYVIDRLHQIETTHAETGSQASHPSDFSEHPILAVTDQKNLLHILNSDNTLGSPIYAIPSQRPGQLSIHENHLVSDNYIFMDGRTYNHILRTDPGRIPGARRAQ